MPNSLQYDIIRETRTLMKQNLDKIGQIKVLSYKSNEDGSATLEFEVDDTFISFFVDSTHKKPTKKNISNFILDMLTKAVAKTDGYDLVKLPKGKKSRVIVP